jgi:hypothetical protein
MTQDIIKKIKDEIKSLTALSIVNIIFGALAIAIGVSTSVSNFNMLKESIQISLTPIISLCFGIGFGIIGLYWLISSTNIIDFTTDIQLGIHTEKTPLTNERITSIIIQMIAFYRKNKKTIKQMILISMIGGCLFMGFTVFSAVNILMKPSQDVLWFHYVQIIGLILMVFLGIACFFIPRFFKRYASVWDGRMNEAEQVEQMLMEQMRSH